jgi:hypothetical protein
MHMTQNTERAGYKFVDMGTTGEGALRTAFQNQVAYCRANGSPITGRVVSAILAALDGPQSNTFLERVRNWQGPPLSDALPLRIAGGIHALHLAGDVPELALIYRGVAADDDAIIERVMLDFELQLLPWLDSPPQTNEAGRSSNFIAAMLWLASKGLPARFECLEIGSSAGINLMIDRYHYDLGGVEIGPQDAPMRFKPEWPASPPPEQSIEFTSIKGCDVAPVDLTDPEQALRLKAFIWPGHTERFGRMEAAITAANERAPLLERMNAADFVERELAKPQAKGVTRVLMHSIVWQYVPKEQQDRVTAAMEQAGSRATEDRPLAWIALEANRTVHKHELRVRYWPGGDYEVMLARAHAHGASIEWFGA